MDMPHNIHFLVYKLDQALSRSNIGLNTESFIHYSWQQTAVARGLAWPAHRFTGRQTAAAREHSLCFLVQFPSNCHVHQCTFAKRRR